MTKQFILMICSFLLLIYPVRGMTLTISPENPVVGDEITITGTGVSPNQVLFPSITFEKTESVLNGKYDDRLYGIKVPPVDNSFTVTAKNVKNLNVRVKILLWWTKSADAVNGLSTVSQSNVPSGAYDIKLDGDAAEGASSVSLTITASSKITADTQGNFEDKYSTSGVPPGNFTLNIGGITRTITLTTPGDKSESAAKSTSSSSSGGGVSSSGGGGASGENFKNIELKEIYDQEIFRDKIISYGFKNKSNPILFVNITSNVSAGEITTSVEVLRNTSSLVKSPASGEVYKNINIWMGTSDFAIPKNIREATISFRVENSWLDNNNLASNVMKMLKWDGSKWMELDTTEKTKDASYTYYEAKTDTFSSFAISGLKNETLPAATSTAVPGINAKEPVITSLTPTTTIATATSTPVKIPGFEAIILITALLVWRLRKI